MAICPAMDRCKLRGAALVFLATLLVAGCGEGETAADYIKDAQKHRAALQISSAIIDLKNALQKEPKNLTARILLAQYYLDLPDPVAAESELSRAKQDGADVNTIAMALTKAELMLGRPERALKEAEAVDARSPEHRLPRARTGPPSPT